MSRTVVQDLGNMIYPHKNHWIVGIRAGGCGFSEFRLSGKIRSPLLRQSSRCQNARSICKGVGNSDICGHNLVLSTANADQVWKGQKETGTGLSIISPSRPTDNETCHIGLIGRYIGNELLQASDYDLRGFRPIPIT